MQYFQCYNWNSAEATEVLVSFETRQGWKLWINGRWLAFPSSYSKVKLINFAITVGSLLVILLLKPQSWHMVNRLNKRIFYLMLESVGWRNSVVAIGLKGHATVASLQWYWHLSLCVRLSDAQPRAASLVRLAWVTLLSFCLRTERGSS